MLPPKFPSLKFTSRVPLSTPVVVDGADLDLLRRDPQPYAGCRIVANNVFQDV